MYPRTKPGKYKPRSGGFKKYYPWHDTKPKPGQRRALQPRRKW